MIDYKFLLTQALEKQDHFDGGSQSVVFNTNHPSFVVKVYKSKYDYELIKEMQGDPHFPIILSEIPYPDFPEWQAVLMERLTTCGPVTSEISGVVNSNGRHWIPSLYVAAQAILEKKLKTAYPASLAYSLEKLYRYLDENGPEFETDLNQPSNWGVREDGTIVILDPLYHRG